MQARRRRRWGRRRVGRGAAVVEMAIVTPILLTMVFGVIEFGWVFMVRQSLTNAAREGCRVAVLQNSTADQVIERVGSYMSATGLTGYSVDYTPADTQGGTNDVETVRVSIPYQSISLVGNFFGPIDFDLASECSMRKEGIALSSSG